MSDQAVFPPVNAVPPLTQWQRVVNAFVAPGKTFDDIRRSASWWLPWVITSVLVIAFVFTVQQKVGWTQVYNNILTQNPKAMERMQQAPANRVAAMKSIGVKATEISSYAQPILLLIGAVIISAVLWCTLNFGFGGQAKYGQVFAVWFYAALPMILIAILGIITLYSGLDPGAFNIKNPVGTNIGYYMSSDAPRWLVTILNSVDIIKIWTAVLLTIGCAKVARIKKSSAAITVFGWWILVVLVSAAFTTL